MKDLQAAAHALGVTVLPLDFKEPNALDRASAAIRRELPDALMHFGYALIGTYHKQIADLALKSRLPTIVTTKRWAEAG